MKTQLSDQEELLKTGKANLQRGLETVGGALYLTNLRLIFEPHALNVQTVYEIIELNDIKQVTLGWTKFLGAIPLFPNVFTVVTIDKKFDFTVFGRKKWAASVSQRISLTANS